MSWDTIKSGYDPQAFYVRASDSQGHVESIGAKVPPFIVGQIEELVENKAFPAYKSKSHVVRDAVVHLLMKRAEASEDKEFMRDCKLMLQQLKIELAGERVRQMRDLIRATKVTFVMTLDAQDTNGLRETIYDAEETILLLDEPYATELRELTDEYRTKLKKMKR